MSEGMYALKPVFNLDAVVQVPDCMYRLPVIQSSQPIEGVGQESNGDSPLAALAARQDAILEKLEHIRDQVAAYQKSLGLPISSSTTSTNKASPGGRTGDLVVRCNPSHPPYSLPILTSMLQGAGLSVFTGCHKHSSVSSLDPALNTFLPDLQQPRATAMVRVTVIWTETVGRDPELLVSPLIQSPIRGEVNLLRYFSRLFPSVLSYESDEASSQDHLLDNISSLLWAPPKNRQPILRSLTEQLTSGHRLSGTPDLGASDLALFSVIKQLKLQGDLGKPQVKKWFTSLEETSNSNGENNAHQRVRKQSHRNRKQSHKSTSPVKAASKSPVKEVKTGEKGSLKSPAKGAKSPEKQVKNEKKAAA